MFVLILKVTNYFCYKIHKYSFLSLVTHFMLWYSLITAM